MYSRIWQHRYVLLGVAGLFVLQALGLWWLGQPALCTCGYIKLWEGVVASPGNSQHLSDWYTFSHVIHGLLFPKLSGARRLVLAVGVEVGWELLENTPMVIEHYREQALAHGYTGDSILNSLSDTASMMLGFGAARVLPVWASIGVGLGLEATSLLFIKDSLALNVLNLVHRFDFIDRWQGR